VLIVGTTSPGTGNCLPFGCPNSNIGLGAPLLEYQQVYSSAAFTGPVTITGILFYNTQDLPGVNSITSGTYTLSLSTTSKAVSGLSSTLSSNIGADQTVIFSGTGGGIVPLGGIEFAGGSFFYDPAKGNLLLDVALSAIGANGGILLDTQPTSGNTTSSRAERTATGSGAIASSGLVTGFDTTASASEPQTVCSMLLACAVGGAAARARRKQPRD
jgi:hypothetical protein